MSKPLEAVYLKNYQPPPFIIDDVELTFDLTDDYTEVKSRMHIRHMRSLRHVSHDLILDGEALTLQAIYLDGKLLTENDYVLSGSHLIIRDVAEQFELEIITRIYPEKNKALSGLYRVKDTYCTQCEAEGFRRITYFIDRPDNLSRFTTTIIADKKRFPYLLSNGNLIQAKELDEGRHLATWEDPFKKPSYLFALVAGDFDLLEDQFVTSAEREVALRIYVEKGYGDQASFAMSALKEAMRWDEKAFGREYDLDIYMIVAIGDFNMGAMENKGLNIFNTKYILAKPETATDLDYIHILSVIGHEYFHNWTGNRVTCRDWFQLSLKEGLTIFRDQSFTEDLVSKTVMRIQDVQALRETQFPEDAGPLAHPVRPDAYIEINNFYTATVYNKGAEVLRMLQTILGENLFRKGMDLYFSKFDGQAVTIEDFVKSMEDVSGLDLTQFRLWYTQAGTPTVTVSEHYDEKNKKYTLSFQQRTLSTPNQPIKNPFFIPIAMGLLNDQGEESFENILHFTKAEETFEFEGFASKPIPSLLRNFSAPVILKFPYSEDTLQFLVEHDTDAFNRYEAHQRYVMSFILRGVNDYVKENPLVLHENVAQHFEYILTQPFEDLFLQAEMLKIPTERYIGEQMAEIKVDAIHATRLFLRTQLANVLHPVFLKHYELVEKNMSSPVQFEIKNIGRRQLKNQALAYLALHASYLPLVEKQFKTALHSNMTDTEVALRALSNMDTAIAIAEESLSLFYDAWQNDALVMDKWFAIQAAIERPGTLNLVKKLLHHPAFDLKNPNKVYALIGTFSQSNPHNFHRIDGEGYAFLAQVVHEIDSFNPQIAARMVKPLTSWRRYDVHRQALMKRQMEWLLHDKTPSKDVYELLTKSLE